MSDVSSFASEEPRLKDLQELFAKCSPVAGGWHRLEDNDNVRYAVWDGQSPDGKKWDVNLPEGKPAFPFDGASDARVFTADDLIDEIADYLTEGFHRSLARVQGNPDVEKTGRAAYARKLIEWMRGTKLHEDLAEEVELHAQNGCAYGASLLHVGWERQLGYRRHTIEMQDLIVMAAGQVKRGRNSILVHFPEMIADATLDKDSAEVLKRIYEAYCLAKKPSNYDWEPQELSTSRALKAVRELRKEGKAELPLPYLCKNQPFIKARKLWEDVFVPDWTGKIQEAPVIFTVDWYVEAELRATAAAEDWDKEWVEEACKRKGEFSAWTTQGALNARIEQAATLGYTETAASDLIEVFTAHRKLVDEDGVLGVYQTVYHGNIKRIQSKRKDAVAWHGLSEDPIGTHYPFVAWRWETKQRSLCSSRGIPQMVATDQRAVKVQQDALTDRTAFEIMPSILVPRRLGVDFRFEPAGQIPLERMDQRPEFMPPPTGNPSLAFSLIEKVEMRIAHRFGRRLADMPPDAALIKRQKRVRSFLLSCSQALGMCFKLITENLPPEQIQQITGMDVPDFGDPLGIEDDTLYLLSFDVQELSPDFVQEKIKAVRELAAGDSTGTIDQAKVIRMGLRYIDPTLELEITNDMQGASQMMLDQVKRDFVNMHNGVPAQYTENDPTAPMQLQFAEQLIRVSPVYQQALKTDAHFRELVTQWLKNRKFSMTQQQNKQVGRVGVQQEEGMEG